MKYRYFIVVFLVAASVHANVTMSPLFGDHMVLQQGMSLPIWGMAEAGEQVTVVFVGQKVTTVAAADGRWRVNLQPVYLRSSPDVLTIDGKNHLEFSDVLVGDVWLCAGQSNMGMPLSQSDRADEEIPRAHDASLRFFVVQQKSAFQPQQTLGGSWQLCTPASAADFSGVGYFFGRDLRKTTELPIGIIGAYCDGTPAQAWMSLSALKKAPSFSQCLADYDRVVHDFPKAIHAYPQQRAAYEETLADWENRVDVPYQKDLADWKTQCDEARSKLQAQPIKPEPASPKPKPPMAPDGGRQLPTAFFNGMIAPLIPYAMTGVIWYQGENNEGPVAALEYGRLFQRLIRSWRAAWGEGPFPFYFVGLANYYKPSAEAVEPMFDEEDNPNPSWAWLREGQSAALLLPETGMVVATDLGDPHDIHPADKLDVGRRLALLARKNVYGEKLVASGPIYRSMKIEGHAIRLTFDFIGNGLTIGTPPWNKGEIIPFSVQLKGFAIAGSNRHWIDATARIEGDSVIVSSELIDHPEAVRYNWANNPAGNLYNKNGLPAAPFRTDDDQAK